MPAVAGVAQVLVPPEVRAAGRHVARAVGHDRPVRATCPSRCRRTGFCRRSRAAPPSGCSPASSVGSIPAGPQTTWSGTANSIVAAPPVVVEAVVANDVVVAARDPQAGADGNGDRRDDVRARHVRVEVVRVEVVVLDQVRVLREARVAGRREDVGRESERVVVEVVVVDLGGVAVGAGVAAGVVVRVAEADLLAVAERRVDARVALVAGVGAGARVEARSRRCRRPRSSASGRGPRRT